MNNQSEISLPREWDGWSEERKVDYVCQDNTIRGLWREVFAIADIPSKHITGNTVNKDGVAQILVALIECENE